MEDVTVCAPSRTGEAGTPNNGEEGEGEGEDAQVLAEPPPAYIGPACCPSLAPAGLIIHVGYGWGTVSLLFKLLTDYHSE
jgi:hypothetical protein